MRRGSDGISWPRLIASLSFASSSPKNPNFSWRLRLVWRHPCHSRLIVIRKLRFLLENRYNIRM